MPIRGRRISETSPYTKKKSGKDWMLYLIILLNKLVQVLYSHAPLLQFIHQQLSTDNSYVCTQMWNESLVSQSWFMAPKHPTSKRFISNWTNMRNLSFNSKLGLDSTQTKFFRRCRTIQWPIDLLPKIPKFNESFHRNLQHETKTVSVSRICPLCTLHSFFI